MALYDAEKLPNGIVESWDNSAWRGPAEVSGPISYFKQSITCSVQDEAQGFTEICLEKPLRVKAVQTPWAPTSLLNSLHYEGVPWCTSRFNALWPQFCSLSIRAQGYSPRATACSLWHCCWGSACPGWAAHCFCLAFTELLLASPLV